MRSKIDINQNQCDVCGKIQRAVKGELVCGAPDTKWEGLALCLKCDEKNFPKEVKHDK